MNTLAQFQIIYALVGDALILGVIVAGLKALANRTHASHALPASLWWSLSAALLVWYILASFLAIQGVFVSSQTAKIPTIPLGVFLPIIAGLLIIFSSKTLTKWVDAIPLHWLIAIQVYRVDGAIFLVLFALGYLPGVFAIPAGTGDLLVGIFALVTARAVRQGQPGARSAAYLWNSAGLLDLMVALATGFLSSPGPLQIFALDHPNHLISAYPLVMIPVFLVPLSIILHVLCLWKLNREESPSAAKT